MLLAALEELTADERSLIYALYYQEKSEREVAEVSGVTQQAAVGVVDIPSVDEMMAMLTERKERNHKKQTA